MSSASAFNALAVAVWVSVGAYNNVDVLGDLSQHLSWAWSTDSRVGINVVWM